MTLQPGRAQRTSAGYRLYDDRSSARLELIEHAKRLGYSLTELADLAEISAADKCAPVQQRPLTDEVLSRSTCADPGSIVSPDNANALTRLTQSPGSPGAARV